MMNDFIKQLLKARILVVMTTLLLSVSAFIFFYYPTVQKHQLRNALDEKVTIISEMVAFGVGIGLGTSNMMVMGEVFNWAKKDSGLRYVAVYGKNGKKIAAFDPDSIRLAPDKLGINSGVVEQNGLLHGIRSVTYGNNEYGMIVIGYSLVTLRKQIFTTRLISIIVCLVLIGLGELVTFLLSKSITGPVRNVIKKLRSSSQEITTGTGQMSSSSQQVSSLANQQASSLEEISSTLEETASMTRRNAENAERADSEAKDTSKAAVQGKTAMVHMVSVIEKIKSSSDKTAKIIKNIDEIAMQTNLLALNAAVEAARAGEAGRGFAVVAEEVRNLAQRSAEAAKETANLIEESRKNTESGVTASKEVTTILGRIAEGIENVAQLITEVANANNEQSRGIEQINTAISEMDDLTQNNASNAEEAASVSKDLSDQALVLNDMVAELVGVVGGNTKLEGENMLSRIKR